MEFAERESDSVEVELESRISDLDLLGVPGLLDALHSVLEERGLLADRAPSVERLREALAGRYRIVGELGRGGNAVVYLAHETALERPVALKVLLASRAGPDAERDKLLREARTAAQLSHPNIVSVHAVEQAGEFVFFTMEYVEGETLAELVSDGGALPVGEATRILHDVARAVGYAHARGVIHRDLKPDNIMIEAESGRVMVMDFGIALVQAQDDINATHYVLGTAPFISPEQVRGGEGDERSDVYALGMTAYYAVGIWGHSRGGFATAGAMFRYPDFFKVGISESGNHDNRNYEDDWGERYQGLLVPDGDSDNYDAEANQTHAANLKGKLLLAHGGMDSNVPPYNTYLVVDALIKANKDFDLLVFPNTGHGYGRDSFYMMRRRWDYFVQHLLGAEPPREYQIGRQPLVP